MPLSEHEQHLLDEMERNLYGSDAGFAAKVAGAGSRRPALRAVFFGVVLVVLGLAGLVAGVLVKFIPLGLAGFALMFAGVILGLSSAGRAPTNPPTASGASSPKAARTSGFMDKLGERWDRRQDDHQ